MTVITQPRPGVPFHVLVTHSLAKAIAGPVPTAPPGLSDLACISRVVNELGRISKPGRRALSKNAAVASMKVATVTKLTLSIETRWTSRSAPEINGFRDVVGPDEICITLVM